jgi:translation initiation factor IF-2
VTSLQADLLPEEWGGEVPFVEISAKKGTGIDELLETVALVAEVEELVGNPDRLAEGTVLESHLDKSKGPVCSLLVQAGTLKVSLGAHKCRLLCFWDHVIRFQIIAYPRRAKYCTA